MRCSLGAGFAGPFCCFFLREVGFLIRLFVHVPPILLNSCGYVLLHMSRSESKFSSMAGYVPMHVAGFIRLS